MSSSIHIAKGGSGYLAHNSREQKTQNAIFSDEQNFCSMNTKEAFSIYREELAIRSQAYSERTRQKVQKNVVTHLSAIVNLQQHHNEHDLQKIVELLEKRLDTKVFQYAIHRDEGHINDKGEPIKNYHAHIEFLGLDSEGASVRKKLTRKELSTLQTEVAKALGMERGRNFAQEWAKYKSGELEKKPVKARRLDTYDFKQAKAQEQATRLATVKEVTLQYKLERDQLKQSGKATQQDYSNLKKKYEELKAQAMSKDLTIQELETTKKSYIKAFREILPTAKNEVEVVEYVKTLKNELQATKRLKTSNETLKERLSVSETSKIDLTNKLTAKTYHLETASKKIESLEAKNKTLSDTVQAFKTAFNELHQSLPLAVREKVVKFQEVVQAIKEQLSTKQQKKETDLEDILNSEEYKSNLSLIEDFNRECEEKYYTDADTDTELK